MSNIKKYDYLQPSSMDDLSRMSKAMAASGLFKDVRDRGLIGTAKLGGCLYYYLPDINKLLQSLYRKPEYIRELEENCKSELRKSK